MSFQCFYSFWHVSTAISTEKPSEPSQRKYVTYLKDPLLMDTNKVHCFRQEVVSQRLKKALHQGHGETIHTRPGGSIQRLPRWSRCLKKTDVRTNDLFTLLPSMTHATAPSLHYGSLHVLGELLSSHTPRAPLQPQPSRQSRASSPGTFPQALLAHSHSEAPTWMAPLLLSWYTLRRGRQTLCVTPAPATAAAPCKAQNKPPLRSVCISPMKKEASSALRISALCTATTLLESLHHTCLYC